MARRAGVSLGTKLILSTVLLLAAAVASSAWYGLTTLDELARAAGEARRGDLEQAIEREAMMLTRNASASASALLANNEYTKLEETARKLDGENPDLVWIAFVEANGSVAAASEHAPVGQGARVDDDLATRLASAPTGQIVSLADPSSAERLLLGIPVVISDSAGNEVRVGAVRLAYDTSRLEQAKQEAIADGRARAKASARKQLVFAGVLLVAGLLLGAWQGVRIGRPLRELSKQARHIAGGDFERRVAVGRGDEIGELGESFNTMAQSLGELVEEMRRKAGLEREVELARSIQGLMTPPPEVVAQGTFRLTGRCEMASACGGDWWSYRHLSDGRLLVVLGDVTGHGMPSAMIAATGRGAVEALTFVDHAGLTPELVLQAIDRAIRDVGGKRLLMTCFALVLSPDGTMRYANAGHTFPYVIHGAGPEAALEVLPVRSNPLGSNHPHIAVGEYALGRGDVLILTSDGLTDRISARGTRFGDKRLRRVLVDEASKGATDVAALCDRIVGDVNEFGGEQPCDDDITLVVVQYTGTGAAAGGGSRARRSSSGKGVAA